MQLEHARGTRRASPFVNLDLSEVVVLEECGNLGMPVSVGAHRCPIARVSGLAVARVSAHLTARSCSICARLLRPCMPVSLPTRANLGMQYGHSHTSAETSPPHFHTLAPTLGMVQGCLAGSRLLLRTILVRVESRIKVYGEGAQIVHQVPYSEPRVESACENNKGEGRIEATQG